MGTAAGIFNHQMTAGQVLTRNAATPMASYHIRHEQHQQFERYERQFGDHFGQ